MKTSKIAAGGLGITLIAAMTLGGAVSSASAADLYVTAVPKEADFASYPAGWFTGTIGGGSVESPHAFTADGLEITGVANGKKQLLNGTVPTQDIVTLANTVETASENADWYFQIPIFGNPTNIEYLPNPNQCDGLQFTTLRPDLAFAGTTDPSVTWVTSGRICDSAGNTVYAPGATATLTQFAAAIQGNGPYTVLAYGYFWDTAVSDTLYWSDNGTDTSFFTPVLSTVITPNPVSVGDFTAAGKGVTISGTGFIPGTDIYYTLYPAGGGTGINLPTQEADANGNVSFKYVGPANSLTGTYTLDTSYPEHAPDDSEALYFFNDFSSTFVVALAATGAAFNPALFIGATSLLLAGAVLMIVRSRKATA